MGPVQLVALEPIYCHYVDFIHDSNDDCSLTKIMTQIIRNLTSPNMLTVLPKHAVFSPTSDLIEKE